MRSSCLKDLGKQWGGEQDLYDLNTVFDNVKKKNYVAHNCVANVYYKRFYFCQKLTLMNYPFTRLKFC